MNALRGIVESGSLLAWSRNGRYSTLECRRKEEESSLPRTAHDEGEGCLYDNMTTTYTQSQLNTV